MTDKDRQCKNCMHFTRDYNSQFDKKKLEEMELGYCMFEHPYDRVVGITHADDRDGFVSVPVMVEECRWCSKFEPREFPCVHYLESIQQENDK